MLFDRICRENGIVHRLTQPRSPTTTGKVERFHQTLRRELLDDGVPFADLAAARGAVTAWVNEYNTVRPHQALGMACPADRFDATGTRAEQDVLPLRLPAAVRLATVPQPRPEPHDLQAQLGSQPQVLAEVLAAEAAAGRPQLWTGGAVEFERMVPASGNMQVARKHFWLGPAVRE